jgi:protease-4
MRSLLHGASPLVAATLSAAGLLVSLSLGCIQIELLGSGRSPLVETVVYSQGQGEPSGAKFVLIEIDGVIGRGSQSSLIGPPEEGLVERVREQLDRARADTSVRGVLLRIDSPGGRATASDVVYAELKRFKKERAIPIVAHFMGIAASGGYYVAMAADEIVAEPTAVTGSIGVIFAGVNISGLMERWGVEDQTITSGPYKDAGSMIRPQTREEREILQGVIDDLQERFQAIVAEGRPKLDRDRVEALSDGRIYSAPQALENGLVDRLGGIEDAVLRLEARADVTESYVVSYHRSHEWRQNLYTSSPTQAPATGRGGLGSALEWLPPGFHYLWPPGALSPTAATRWVPGPLAP